MYRLLRRKKVLNIRGVQVFQISRSNFKVVGAIWIKTQQVQYLVSTHIRRHLTKLSRPDGLVTGICEPPFSKIKSFYKFRMRCFY